MQTDSIDPSAYARRWKTLGVLSLSLLIIGLDNTVLNVALPTLQTHFSASGSTLQWIVDSYLLAFAGVLLTMGTLGDRFGRKRALQSGLVLFGVSSVLAAFAQTPTQLIVLRAAMGIGGAMIMPATLSVIMDIFPREERGRRSGSGRPSPASASGSGRSSADSCSSGSPGARCSGSTCRSSPSRWSPDSCWSPRAATRDPGRSTSAAAACRSRCSSRSSTAIIEAGPRGWTDPVVLGCFAAAAVLAPRSSSGSARRRPMLPLGFFADPRFTVASSASGSSSSR